MSPADRISHRNYRRRVDLGTVRRDEGIAWMLSITLFCIVLWILTPIPPAYTGLLGIGLLAVSA